MNILRNKVKVKFDKIILGITKGKIKEYDNIQFMKYLAGMIKTKRRVKSK